MCTIDNDGILYSTDEHANVVLMLSTSGDTIGWWGEFGPNPGQLNAPSGITLDSENNLWVVNCNNHNIQNFSREGQFLGGWGDYGTDSNQLNHPWGITIDPIDNSLLVAGFHLEGAIKHGDADEDSPQQHERCQNRFYKGKTVASMVR